MRWGCVAALCVGIGGGCSAKGESGTSRSGPEDLTADDSDIHLGVDASTRCTPGEGRRGEFDERCLDDSASSPDARSADAGLPPAPPMDASLPPKPPLPPKPDATPPGPPPASTGGPCAIFDQKTCQDAFFETDPVTADCDLDGDRLTLSYTTCEVCDLAGTRNQYAVVVHDCGGCSQVFSANHADETWLDPLECDSVSMTEDIGPTHADETCIDVYARVGTSGTDFSTDGLFQVRMCRCDRRTDTCVTCGNGACDGFPS